jgi:hypothetical protein
MSSCVMFCSKGLPHFWGLSREALSSWLGKKRRLRPLLNFKVVRRIREEGVGGRPDRFALAELPGALIIGDPAPADSAATSD